MDEPPEIDGEPRSGLPTWQRTLLILAGVFVVLGLGLQGYGMATGSSEPDPAPTASSGGNQALTNQFLPGMPGSTDPQVEPQETESEGVESWSPFFVKGGFGFFVGFCVGYALRMFFKLSAVFVGLFFLGLFGLAHYDLVLINEQAFSDAYDNLVVRIGDQFESFKTFVVGSVPSTGLASLGLFTGFKRG